MNNKLVGIKNPNVKKYKFVEWKPHNYCNYSCSYCGPVHNGNNQKWLDLSDYKRIAGDLMDEADAEGKIIYFNLTGGEPTLYPLLLDFLEYIENRGHITQILTNGSRTLRYWQEFADSNIATSVWISVHYQQNLDIEHIFQVMECFVGKKTVVAAKSIVPVDYFDIGYATHKRFLTESECWASMSFIRHFYNKNTTNSFITDYTQEQKTIFEKNIGVISERAKKISKYINHINPWRTSVSVYEDGTTNVSRPGTYVLNGTNNFYGWDCEIGLHRLFIDYDTVYRGICKNQGKLGSVYEKVSFSKASTICEVQRCNCAPDILQPKKIIPITLLN